MDTFKRFIKFIEISTKLASLVPFFMALAYAFYLTGHIDALNTLIFAIAMMLFDIPVTMINNYLDKRRSGETPHFSKAASLGMIIPMVTASALIGVYLTYKFGLVILLTGMTCFFVGIFYSASPISISRTPYGEIVSGFIQGLCLPFMAVFINARAGFFIDVNLDINQLTASAAVNILNMIKLGFMCAPAMICVSNIMLANNTCDVERDAASRRYTLPYYIGKEKALILFKLLYAAVFADIIIAVIIRAIPPVCLAVLLTVPFAMKNTAAFARNPVKSKTFILSLNNFIIILIPYIITLFIGGAIRWWEYR